MIYRVDGRLTQVAQSNDGTSSQLVFETSFGSVRMTIPTGDLGRLAPILRAAETRIQREREAITVRTAEGGDDTDGNILLSLVTDGGVEVTYHLPTHVAMTLAETLDLYQRGNLGNTRAH